MHAPLLNQHRPTRRRGRTGAQYVRPHGRTHDCASGARLVARGDLVVVETPGATITGPPVDTQTRLLEQLVVDEEVVALKVHPEWLEPQRLPSGVS